MLVLEVTDCGLHGRAPAEGALDGSGEPALLACDVDLEALVLWCVVAFVPGIRNNPVERGPDSALDGRDDRCARVPVIGVARQRLDMGDKLATPAAVEGVSQRSP